MSEYIPGELAVTIAANSLHTGIVGQVTSAIYSGLEPMFSVVYVLAVAALVAWVCRDYRAGLAFGGAIAATWLPVVALKVLFTRPRPPADLLPHAPAIPATDWSFPSGHVAFVVAAAVAVFFFTKLIWARVLAAAAVPVIAVVVLICGYHYPTDVLASIEWSLCVGPLMVTLACLVGSRLPALSGLGRGRSSGSPWTRSSTRRTPRSSWTT